jgi:hypothetical protein
LPPLREATQYQLRDLGLRVVSGRNEDDEGADSNGAGKTALVMAPLWAITGRSDARAEVRNSGGAACNEEISGGCMQ